MSEKYRITIPYRNRENNLNRLLPILKNYFLDQDCIIQVIEQDNDDEFNLAYLVNIGFDIFKKNEVTTDWTYVFHPVDCYPIDVDYSVYDNDIVAIYQKDEIFPKAFSFNCLSYKSMNGYSNDYWGWGGEDWEPGKKATTFGLSFEHRYVTFDKSEDISNGDNATNIRNIEILHSKRSKEDFYRNGLNAINYSINSTLLKHDINIYKVNFHRS